jgi:Fe2+ transport system protein FeoA
MTLADAEKGDKLRILKVQSGGGIRQRMLDMGIIKGSEIIVERYAPLCDPIHIKVKGYSLALRVSEGKMIEVEKI